MKNSNIRKIALAVALLCIVSSQGYCQDVSHVLGEVASVYANSETSGSAVIGGFSAAGLFGGILFGCTGFGAFIYGKKSAQFKPMIIGILLMGYPYFTKNTIALYAIGVTLIAALYIFRE